MGRKKGGGARTPNIEKNTLHSAQKIKVVDLVSSGEIHGFINGNDDPLKSIYLNGTPIQNNDGSLNFSGVRAEFNAGEEDQDYLASFTSSDRSIEVAARVKKDVPVTRTVYNKQVTSLRVTVGVDALMRSTKEGDQLKTHVDMSVSLIKDGNYYTSKIFSLNEKGSKPFYHDLVFDDLPEAPFDIKCTRITPDSTDTLLRNDTYFFSYVESIDAKMRYPLSAIVGLEVDSAQFGNNLPVRTYGIKGCEVLVPSNYDPATREYSGLWDRLFKPAYTNNPVWVLYDLLTNPIDGFGSRDLKIDIDKFYEASKYCDELVDDGNGKKEPRFVCNAVIQGGKAYDVINNVCSSFRAVPAYNGEYFTIYYDRAHDVTAIYNNSNVVDGMFTYSSTDRTEQYNQVQVQFADEENGYETTIEEVADDRHIAKHGINTLSIVAFGATKRSYALRTAWWNLVTNLTEKEIVTFKTGAQGIKHEIYDIIQIADNDYVGASMGARIASIDGAKVTLDRDIDNVKKLVIDTKDGIKTIDVKRQLSGREFELAIAPNIVEFAPCTAILDHVNARLFRCTSIAENDDGTFTITAIQHNPQKESIVDKGATYIPESSTTINPTPSLSNGVADNDGRAIILRWDAMTVVGADNTYRIQLFKDKVLYQTFETDEAFLELENLPQGEYVAKIRAINSNGQHSAELVITFSTTYKIDGLRAKPVAFGVELSWQLPVLITSEAFTEIWRSEQDDRMTATKFLSVAYPQNNYPVSALSVGDEHYYWFRLVDLEGNQGEFSHSIKGSPLDNADDLIGMMNGKIGEKQISKGLKDQFDKNIDDRVEKAKEEIKSELDGIEIDLTGINSEIDNIKSEAITTNSNLENVKESAEKALSDAEKNAQAIKGQLTVIDEVKTSQDQSEASWQLAQMSNVSAQKSNFARSMTMGAQVARNIAKIEEIDSFVVTEQSATATRFTQINTRVDNAESKITSVETSLTSDIKAEASKREALEAVFDLSKAQQQLQLMTQSTADQSLSSRLFSMSASTANAHAKYDELQEVVATNEDARVTSEQKLQAEINTSKSEIERVETVLSSDLKSQATTINNLSSSLEVAKADIKTAEQAIVDNEKAQARQNTDFNVRFEESGAKQQLAILTESSNIRSLSQRYFSLSAQTANSSAKLEQLQKVFADSETAWAVTEERLQSEIDSSKSEISRLDKTIAENDKAQSVAISNLTSKVNKSEADIASVKSTQASDKQSLTQEINSAKSEWKSSVEVKYLASSDVEKTPREYADLYGRTTVVEFGGRAHFGLDAGTYHTVTTTISYLTGLDRGRVTQRAVSNDFAVTVRERKSASDETWTPWIEIEDVAGAQRKADEAQKEAVRISKASIDSLAQTQANDKKALTEQINSANSNINNHSASITEIRKTQADTAGKVASMWTMKVDGNGVIGGIMLGSDGHESMLKFAADNFVISTGDQSRNLFTIQRVNNRQVAVLNVNDFILPGSLSAEAIRANTKLSSPRIEGGTITGSSLNIGNGACTIQSNGDFYARNGTFEGTVFADKIRGDVVQMFTLSSAEKRDELIFKITSDASDRYLYIPRIAVGMRLAGTGAQVKNLKMLVDIDESNIFDSSNATSSSSYIMSDIDSYTGSVYTRLISLGGITHRIQKGRECFITIRAEYTNQYYNPEVYARVRSGVILTTKSQNLLSPIN